MNWSARPSPLKSPTRSPLANVRIGTNTVSAGDAIADGDVDARAPFLANPPKKPCVGGVYVCVSENGPSATDFAHVVPGPTGSWRAQRSGTTAIFDWPRFVR